MDKLTTDYVLERGVEQILPDKKGLKNLMEKRKITLYQGFDPSASSLHLGNFIGIRKLAQFQKLGHKVIFLIGDFTGMIGDPTDKSAARKKLTFKEVTKNAEGWVKQVENIIDFKGENKAEIKRNSNWLSKLTFKELVELASNFTVQQMIERDFFQERIKHEKPIHLHEFLYPLMQGYDSVEMGVDLEIGGNDQLFNMLAGRTLMKQLSKKDKYVLTMKLMTDPSGKKMGKSEGNTVNLTDSPEDIYGKIMALPDNLLELGIELLTDLPMETSKKDPLVAKKELAKDVVRQIKGKESSEKAAKHFEKTFQKGEPEYKSIVSKKETLLEIVSDQVDSNSEAKRLLSQGAVSVNGKKEDNPSYKISGGEKIKIGKKTFVSVEG